MHILPTELDLSDACFINKDTVYISGGGGFTTGIVFKTEDGGTTWDTLSIYNRGVNSVSYKNGFLSVSESGTNFRYTSDFVNWGVNQVPGWWGWHKHVRLQDNRIYLVGGRNFGEGYIHAHNPGEQYFYKKDSFNHELRDIIATENRTLHLVGYGVIMKSTDDGTSWIVSNITGDFFRGVNFVNDNIGYVVGEYGSVYKTTNGGDSWSKCREANAVFADESKLLRDVAFWDENTGFLVGLGNTVLRTTDGGKTWKRIENLDGYADFTSITIQYNKAYITGTKGHLLIIDLV